MARPQKTVLDIRFENWANSPFDYYEFPYKQI